MKSGYLYVLIHPSNPNLFKIGVTVLRPEERLTQHNRNHAEYAGKIVKETGQKWELKTFIPVRDPYWAEAQFWSATGMREIPFRGGLEVIEMDWGKVEAGLNAATNSGLRPEREAPKWVHAYDAWMTRRLKGRGITLLGHVRSKVGKSNFKCSEGHQWRTIPNLVANGEGCPTCGMGEMPKEAVDHMVDAGSLCLLVHPEFPGHLRIEVTPSEPNQFQREIESSGWELHRYRKVDQRYLAQKVFWSHVGRPIPEFGESVDMELWEAEQAFRDLVSQLR